MRSVGVFRLATVCGFVAFLALLAGCGGGSYKDGKASLKPSHSGERPGQEAFKPEQGAEVSYLATDSGSAVSRRFAPNVKIIYQASVSLAVQNLDTFTEQLDRLLEHYEGYVANMEISGTPDTARSGKWRLRIPATSLRSFLKDLMKLGEISSNWLESQDVSETYYDLEARIKVAEMEEKRLLDLLREATGKLSEILILEKELARVRTEIERMTGQLRRLANLVEYSTVSVSVQELQRYQPETAPDLWTRMQRASSESLAILRSAGENLLVFCAFSLPWLPIVLVLVLLLWLTTFLVSRRLGRAAAWLAQPERQSPEN